MFKNFGMGSFPSTSKTESLERANGQTEYAVHEGRMSHESCQSPGNRPPGPDSVAGSVRHRITYKAPFRTIEVTAQAFAGHLQQKQTVDDIDELIRKRRSSKKPLTSHLLRCAMEGSTKRERPAMIYARELGPSQNTDEKTNHWSDEDVDDHQGNTQPNTARQPAKPLERTLRNLVCRSAFGEPV
jgi:hypothetical protein